MLWKSFIESISNDIDPVLYAMFSESDFVKFDANANQILIRTLKKFEFFQDLFIEHKASYQDILNRFFKLNVLLVIAFEKESEKKIRKKKHLSCSTESVATSDFKKNENITPKNDVKLNKLDKEKWRVTYQLLDHFGGTVSEIRKDIYEQDA